MLKEYPKFKKGEVEEIYKKLSKAQKEELDKLLTHRGGITESKIKDLRRYLIQEYFIIGGTFKKKIADETEADKLSLIIKQSNYSKDVKKNLLIDTASTLRYIHSDWAVRFRGLEKFKPKSLDKGDDSEPKEYDILTDEEIKKTFGAEERLYYKCFFKTSEQTGLRIKEVRTIQNEKIEFNKDGTATINIWMTKTGKKKFVFVDSETAELIKKLQEQQRNTGTEGKYLFNSPMDKDQPISKNQVCLWFRNLTKRAIGRACIPYSLRHRRATILYKLAKENKISKDTAMDLLGHGKDMSERYTHITEEERKRILKEQAFILELPEDKRNQLEKQIDDLQKQVNELKQAYDNSQELNLDFIKLLKENPEKFKTLVEGLKAGK